MNTRRIIPLLILFVVIIGLIWLVRGRRGEAVAAANPIVLCPGPDAYGYTCDNGAVYAYLDASHDTFLYEDDGVLAIELPFPFTFYGTTYQQVTASSNGNLQFSTADANYANACLELPVPADDETEAFPGAAVPGMGDMIAPYWTDLDLRFYGYLETEVFGEEPNRIFVIEWDNIPPYDSEPEDGITFEVQLFEGSNDIVFLYQDVTSLTSNGRNAAALLQSEAQGLAIQYSCNQAAIADLSGIAFPHPVEPDEEWGLDDAEEGEEAEANATSVVLKADAAALLHTLNLSSNPEARLVELRLHWASQAPARLSQWQWADINNDQRPELLLLWRSKPQLEQSRLLVLSPDSQGTFTLLADVTLSSRTVQFEQLELAEVGDVTGDNKPEILLHDAVTGQSRVLVWREGRAIVYPLTENCKGRLGIVEGDIVRDGCGRERITTTWNGLAFMNLPR